jgi:hypothetical protein
VVSLWEAVDLYHGWRHKSGMGKVSHIDKFCVRLRQVFLTAMVRISYLVSRISVVEAGGAGTIFRTAAGRGRKPCICGKIARSKRI